MLVCVEENVPAEITALTGLSAAELQQGTEPREALNSFLLFIGKAPLVGHNIAFDLEFLRMTCKRYGFPAPTNRQIDLAQLARRNLARIANYKLVTLAQHFQLAEKANPYGYGFASSEGRGLVSSWSSGWHCRQQPQY